MSFNRGRFPARPRPVRPHAFIVGAPVGERIVVRITTTRVLLECRCGSINAIPIRRLEKEQPQVCRRCGGGADRGSAAKKRVAIGQRFGTRCVTGFDMTSDPRPGGETFVELVCDCGATGRALPRHLAAGIANRCDECADALRGVPLRNRGEVQDVTGLGVDLIRYKV